jgi:hypothetical protein
LLRARIGHTYEPSSGKEPDLTEHQPPDTLSDEEILTTGPGGRVHASSDDDSTDTDTGDDADDMDADADDADTPA